MKILVTGIKGFLGRNLVGLFCDHDVVGLGSKNEYYKGVKVYSSCSLDLLPKDFDAVIICHAAVSSGNNHQSINNLFESNINLTKNLVHKYRQARLIFTSTASIFANNNTTITEHTASNPVTDYAISKYWAERIVLEVPNAKVIRYPSLFGIGMRENTLIPNYVNMAIQKGEIQVWGDGSRRQNYLHVSDAANYLWNIFNKYDELKESMFLGVAKCEFSNLEIANIIVQNLNCKIVHVQQDDSLSVSYNNSLTNKYLNWQPVYSLVQGINEYIAWKKK